jgi:hypothetical protein
MTVGERSSIFTFQLYTGRYLRYISRQQTAISFCVEYKSASARPLCSFSPYQCHCPLLLRVHPLLLAVPSTISIIRRVYDTQGQNAVHKARSGGIHWHSCCPAPVQHLHLRLLYHSPSQEQYGGEPENPHNISREYCCHWQL